MAGNKFGGTTSGRNDASTWVVRFVDFRVKSKYTKFWGW